MKIYYVIEQQLNTNSLDILVMFFFIKFNFKSNLVVMFTFSVMIIIEILLILRLKTIRLIISSIFLVKAFS